MLRAAGRCRYGFITSFVSTFCCRRLADDFLRAIAACATLLVYYSRFQARLRYHHYFASAPSPRLQMMPPPDEDGRGLLMTTRRDAIAQSRQCHASGDARRRISILNFDKRMCWAFSKYAYLMKYKICDTGARRHHRHLAVLHCQPAEIYARLV